MNESDSQAADVNKGWSSVQAIPRAVWLDRNTLKGLIQDPIEEVKTLRGSKVQQGTVKLAPGEVLGIRGATGRQVNGKAIFYILFLEEFLGFRNLLVSRLSMEST